MVATPSVDTDWTYRGVEAAILENEQLRIVLLPGKGGDVLEFRDKRRDANVLWEAPHEWTPPADRGVPAETPTTWQTDHYPGGWQVNLPIAGYGADIDGSAYGLHGESALRPWDATVVRDDDAAVTLRLTTDLLRYPFRVERELTLADGPRLTVDETVMNVGDVDLEYVWQHHLTFGRPLVGPAARVDVPATRGRVEAYGDGFPNARLESDAVFDWPHAPGADGGTVDLSTEVPPPEAETHDVAFATDLDAGWYALTNPDLDLGVAVTFPTDPFESVWYWQPFGGFKDAPFYGRNYNVGLEPTTAYPSDGLFDAQRETGTLDVLPAGASVDASFVVRTYTGATGVEDVSPDGEVEPVGSGGSRR
jgi:galactose mutarotase-like enzyme